MSIAYCVPQTCLRRWAVSYRFPDNDTANDTANDNDNDHTHDTFQRHLPPAPSVSLSVGPAPTRIPTREGQAQKSPGRFPCPGRWALLE
jgi:hypothetical protein